MRLSTRTKRRGLATLAATIVALGVMLCTAPMAGAAAKCDPSRFTNPDGSTDVTSYLQCSSPTLSETTVSPGASITFSGGGFASGSKITISVTPGPVVLGSTTADADGNFSVVVTLPTNISTGAHRLEATGVDLDGNPLTVSLEFTVVAAGATAAVTPSGSLPYTGSDAGRIALVGAAAVLVGGAGVWGARRVRAGHRAAA
jgi:LPXTG-motif cell wall-anchored protein